MIFHSLNLKIKDIIKRRAKKTHYTCKQILLKKITLHFYTLDILKHPQYNKSLCKQLAKKNVFFNIFFFFDINTKKKIIKSTALPQWKNN